MRALTIRLEDEMYDQIKLRGQLQRRKVGPQILFMLAQVLDEASAESFALLNPGKSDQT
jgi:hypothetical protein